MKKTFLIACWAFVIFSLAMSWRLRTNTNAIMAEIGLLCARYDFCKTRPDQDACLALHFERADARARELGVDLED